jgi:hypothetical protein
MNLPLALQQIEFARSYVLATLEGVEEADWFAMPAGCPTHLAWQIGHLAMAEYGLCLFRVRGRQEADLSLMTSSFRKLFSRGSAPQADTAKYPSMAEIRATLDRIHAQVLLEAPSYTPEQLAEPVEMPYAVHANKLGGLIFCSHHEMLHAGQIGLIRRLLGKQPIR